MIKKLAVGTTFLAVVLAIQPTAALAQERYYGNAYDNGYRNDDRYVRDRYLEHEAHESRQRWERERAYREHERRERLRRYKERQYRYHSDRY